MSVAEPERPGHWLHAPLFSASLTAESWISIGEGLTPLQDWSALGERLGIPQLWAKREDLNPTGSHKARSASLLCSAAGAEGASQLVISSSGNAAVAAAACASAAGMRLLALVSPRTPAVKLERLLAQDQLVVLSDEPVAMLHHAVERWGLVDLRASTNPLGPAAYRGIAAELLDEGGIAEVFVCASSGATALGICEGFRRLSGARPRVHLVQPSPGGELTRRWYPGSAGDADPPAFGELGARRTRLAPRLRRMVADSGGRGWQVGGGAVREVRGLAEEFGLRTSWEGLAVLAAMRDAGRQTGPSAEGRWVAVLTGADWQLELSPAVQPELLAPQAGSKEELDRLLHGHGFQRPVPPA